MIAECRLLFYIEMYFIPIKCFCIVTVGTVSNVLTLQLPSFDMCGHVYAIPTYVPLLNANCSRSLIQVLLL